MERRRVHVENEGEEERPIFSPRHDDDNDDRQHDEEQKGEVEKPPRPAAPDHMLMPPPAPPGSPHYGPDPRTSDIKQEGDSARQGDPLIGQGYLPTLPRGSPRRFDPRDPLSIAWQHVENEGDGQEYGGFHDETQPLFPGGAGPEGPFDDEPMETTPIPQQDGNLTGQRDQNGDTENEDSWERETSRILDEEFEDATDAADEEVVEGADNANAENQQFRSNVVNTSQGTIYNNCVFNSVKILCKNTIDKLVNDAIIRLEQITIAGTKRKAGSVDAEGQPGKVPRQNLATVSGGPSHSSTPCQGSNATATVDDAQGVAAFRPPPPAGTMHQGSSGLVHHFPPPPPGAAVDLTQNMSNKEKKRLWAELGSHLFPVAQPEIWQAFNNVTQNRRAMNEVLSDLARNPSFASSYTQYLQRNLSVIGLRNVARDVTLHLNGERAERQRVRQANRQQTQPTNQPPSGAVAAAAAAISTAAATALGTSEKEPERMPNSGRPNSGLTVDPGTAAAALAAAPDNGIPPPQHSTPTNNQTNSVLRGMLQQPPLPPLDEAADDDAAGNTAGAAAGGVNGGAAGGAPGGPAGGAAAVDAHAQANFIQEEQNFIAIREIDAAGNVIEMDQETWISVRSELDTRQLQEGQLDHHGRFLYSHPRDGNPGHGFCFASSDAARTYYTNLINDLRFPGSDRRFIAQNSEESRPTMVHVRVQSTSSDGPVARRLNIDRVARTLIEVQNNNLHDLNSSDHIELGRSGSASGTVQNPTGYAFFMMRIDREVWARIQALNGQLRLASIHWSVQYMGLDVTNEVPFPLDDRENFAQLADQIRVAQKARKQQQKQQLAAARGRGRGGRGARGQNRGRGGNVGGGQPAGTQGQGIPSILNQPRRGRGMGSQGQGQGRGGAPRGAAAANSNIINRHVRSLLGAGNGAQGAAGVNANGGGLNQPPTQNLNNTAPPSGGGGNHQGGAGSQPSQQRQNGQNGSWGAGFY